MNLIDLFSGGIKKSDTEAKTEEVIQKLKLDKELLKKCEDYYLNEIISKEEMSDNFFKVNSREAASQKDKIAPAGDLEKIVKSIVEELKDRTNLFVYEDGEVRVVKEKDNPRTLVSKEELMSIPEEFRPNLSGTLSIRDIWQQSYSPILFMYNEYVKHLESGNPTEAFQFYMHFLQGLDLLDIDPIVYEIIRRNKNSMGNWLPQIIEANKNLEFFKIPNTKIIEVPISLLQLTRMDYMKLSPTTMNIVDRYIHDIFELDDNKSYFIKTGTYSSKFDFRNAKVTTPKEVQELGEYLLYIHYQALSYASPLNNVSMPGASTTVEWVVRDFIEDVEENPTIYKGLSLRTEFRAFVDFDTKEVIGIDNYWRPDLMEKRFSKENQRDTGDKHDYVTYMVNKDKLIKDFENNKDLVVNELLKLVNECSLTGQYSVDIMKNGNDFYIIDMALASESALKDCVPAGKLKSQNSIMLS